MAKKYPHVADISGQLVGYSAIERPDRGKWELRFLGPDGKRVRSLTSHDVRGKTPPTDFHTDAVRLIRNTYRPPKLFPSLDCKGWDELLSEVEKSSPHTRPETLRSFRAGIKAVREIMPDVASPVDMTEERIRRFCKLWLAAPSKQNTGKPRSPVTLSYYVRALSAFSNHLIDLGYTSRNPWHGVRVPKAEKHRKPVPSEDETTEFFAWVRSRYPEWRSLHALLELKAVSACRTADVCQLRADQLGDGRLTFGAGQSKTKVARSLPLPAALFATLKAVAGPGHLWEGEFWEGIKRFRKQSNGLPPSFTWRTVYAVVNNLFREFNDSRPDRPRFTPHGLRRRAITVTVAATGSVDAAAVAIGVHAQTARAHYLDAERAFQTDEVMAKVAEALRPKLPSETPKRKGKGG